MNQKCFKVRKISQKRFVNIINHVFMFVQVHLLIYSLYTIKIKYKIETKGGEMSIWLQVVPRWTWCFKTKPLWLKTRQVATLNETPTTPRTRLKSALPPCGFLWSANLWKVHLGASVGKGPKLLRAELGHFCTHITSLLFEFKRPNMAAGGRILLLCADANEQQVNEVYYLANAYK